MKILIIGGTGAFGAFYAKLLQNNGFEIGINSRSEEKGKGFCRENGYTFESSAKGYDIVIISVPNETAMESVKSVSNDLDKGALLIDFCSVKSHIVPELEKLSEKREDLEIASIHPMHGPRVKSLEEIPIVLIPIKVGEKFELIKKSVLKNMFLKKNIKIGNKGISKFSEFIQKFAEDLVDKALRQAKLSGRKIIRAEDIE